MTPDDIPEEILEAVAVARACRWGYVRTLDADAFETFLRDHGVKNQSLRHDLAVALPLYHKIMLREMSRDEL